MYPQAAQLVADGVLDPATVITHAFGWHDATEAFQVTTERPDEVVRAVLHGEW